MFTIQPQTPITNNTIASMVVAVCLIFWLSACSPEQNDTPSDQVLKHIEETTQPVNTLITTDTDTTSELQAIIIGEFSGKIQCDKCPYNRTSLQLNIDGTVEKILFDTAQQDMSTRQTIQGTYAQNGDIITIKFDANPLDLTEEHYKLQDHYLIQLTNDLQVPTQTVLLQD